MTTTTKKKKTEWKVAQLPPNPFISEILELVHKQRTKAHKVKVLQHYRDDALTAILIWNFDPSVVSALPDGDVPYKPNDVPEGTDHTSLRREWKNLYHFIKVGNDGLNSLRRESMVVQMLECLHESEAALLVNAKDKKLHQVYKGLSTNVVCEAFNWNDNFMLMQ